MKEKHTYKEMLDDLDERMAKRIDETFKRVAGTYQTPEGYTKCTGCGRLIPVDRVKDCPYCEKPEPEPKKDEDDGVGGILDVLDEDED